MNKIVYLLSLILWILSSVLIGVFRLTSFILKMTVCVILGIWKVLQITRIFLRILAIIVDYLLEEIKEWNRRRRGRGRGRVVIARGRRQGYRRNNKDIQPSIQLTSTAINKTLLSLNNSSTMTNFCKKLVDDFNELAEDLEPTQEYIRAGRKAAHVVFELLKEQSGHHNIRIARTKVAGSVGKGTGISFEDDDDDGVFINPDFDCVSYINDRSPPFEKILVTWSKILESHRRIQDVRVTRCSVQFIYVDPNEGEINFDLLPAHNYVQQNINPKKTVGQVQAELAMQVLSKKQQNYIRKGERINMDLNKLHSSSFSENTVEFIQGYVDDKFILDQVRFAKFWCANLEFSGYVAAKSCLVELIAIYAQQKWGCGRTCPVSGFRRFLESMANFRQLCVCFNQRNKLPYELSRGNNNPRDGGILEGGDEASYLLTSGEFSPSPIILDPTNHFNNFAYGISEEAIELFETQATQTLEVLEDLRRSEDYKNVENAIDEIFCHKR